MARGYRWEIAGGRARFGSQSRMSSDRPASASAPTDDLRTWAVATVTAALRADIIELDDAEDRLDRIYKADKMADVYDAIAGLPHPPAPLDLSKPWKR